MEWYVPITIIPGVALIVTSTTTQILALSSELNSLLSKKCDSFQHTIAAQKLKQLNLLTRANFFLYLSIALYVFSGIVALMITSKALFSLPNLMLYAGTLALLIAIVQLNIFAFRAVKIRHNQFSHNEHLI